MGRQVGQRPQLLRVSAAQGSHTGVEREIVRVIAGTLKGRRIQAPSWPGLRPTSDKLRETLFNILGPRVVDTHVLDACAGTGAVGIEAISRSARHVTFVDRDRRAVDLIAQNLARCAVVDGYTLICADLGSEAYRLRHATDFDVIFLDPPYDTDATVLARAVGDRLAADGVLIIEYARRTGAPSDIEDLQRTREVTSGDSALGFYVKM